MHEDDDEVDKTIIKMRTMTLFNNFNTWMTTRKFKFEMDDILKTKFKVDFENDNEVKEPEKLQDENVVLKSEYDKIKKELMMYQLEKLQYMEMLRNQLAEERIQLMSHWIDTKKHEIVDDESPKSSFSSLDELMDEAVNELPFFQ